MTRQKIRKGLILISFFLFPALFYYLSPALILDASSKGIVNGSFIMSIEHYTTFIVASAILLVIPGPTVLMVVSYSITHGRRANAPLVAAVALGDSTALTLSLLGLGALLAVSSFWFSMVKWVGGLYLLWLGVRLICAGVSSEQTPEKLMPDSQWRLFVNTYLVTALNPKGILFFIAFLPQFVSRNGNVTFQLWLLACTFVTMATVNATMYAIFAASARKMLTSARARRCIRFAGGLMLSAAGLWALMARRSI